MLEGEQVRVWCIGSDRTEFYAAYSEEEVRLFLAFLVGQKEAEKQIAEYFEKVPESKMDEEFDFTHDGVPVRTTWRKEVTQYQAIPAQVATSYN